MSVDVSKMPKLGFGLMRLPEKDGEIDMSRVCDMVDTSMKNGMNYFDTAYVYHGGKSEVAAREAIVKRYPRDSFYLATKLPAWEIHSLEDRDRVFDIQCERAGVDYFDFYLLHSVEDGSNYDKYVQYDCFQWAVEKKKQGKIKHFGFSFHGTPALLEKLVEEHPEVEFVQIQLNYVDWDNPIVHSGKLYEILRKRNIPMIIMEPVKGGLLAKLEEDLEAILKAENSEASIASWAFRFVASLDGVVTILSGMSTEEQMQDNIHTFANFKKLTEKEQAAIAAVVEKMHNMPLIPCTSCRYCVDGCPSGILIPDVFGALNTKRRYPEGDNRPHFFYNGLVGRSGRAGDCIACGQCESVCPQHLPIINLLKEASEKLDK